DVNFGKELANGRSADADFDLARVFLPDLLVFLFGQKLLGLEEHFIVGVFEVFQDDVARVIDHAFEIGNFNVEQGADAGRGFAEEPNVGDGDGQLDVSHALAADLGFGDFHAAAVADDALVLDPLVFAAVTFPVADRAENPFAEKTVALRLEGPVVDGLGFA